MGKPKIRFKGYEDDWEQRKLSEIAIEKLSNGIMNNQANDETGLRHINVINMYDPDKIHPEKLTFSNYDEDAVKKCNVEWGDIFLTRSSLKPEGIAESNVLLDSGPKHPGQDNAVILEFKVRSARKGKSLEETAQSAIAQIRERKYSEELKMKGITDSQIKEYGVAFEGKTVLIVD